MSVLRRVKMVLLLSMAFGLIATLLQVLFTSGRKKSAASLIVDVGYARYKGTFNDKTGLNSWLGVRYAASPTGTNRWQRPKAPHIDRKTILDASRFGPPCPQNPLPPSPVDQLVGDEDCLSLSVYAPPGANNFPVLFQIHGGGYLIGAGQNDLGSLIKTGNKSFVGVDIQYRLGAFGFLSSEEVEQKGVLNAGLLDQKFALEWTKANIHLFGGDADRVTIGGESAGGGSVLHHVLGYGGSLGTSLFQGAWTASPYLPRINRYNDPIPKQNYEAFAREAGCLAIQARPAVFDCLVSKPVATLQRANHIVSTAIGFDQLAFLPVMDGDYIQDLPSKALSDRKLNGMNLLSSNNANEGAIFVPPSLKSLASLKSYLKTLYPSLTPTDLTDLLAIYLPTNPPPTSPILYATYGESPPTALTLSTYATGYQQAAYNIFAEQTFICPSYFLSEAFAPPPITSPLSFRASNDKPTHNQHQRKGYRYQYSTPGAIHADDIAAYFGGPSFIIPAPDLPHIFVSAVQTLLSKFIVTGIPSVNGGPEANIQDWPVFELEEPKQVVLNVTGKATMRTTSAGTSGANITVVRDDESVRNWFRVVDARSWEGGRGERCDFWRRVGERVPF